MKLYHVEKVEQDLNRAVNFCPVAQGENRPFVYYELKAVVSLQQGASVAHEYWISFV